MVDNIRVAIFGSFYRGYFVLQKLISLMNQGVKLEIVGVATDNPSNTFISKDKRVWQYGYSCYEEQLVKSVCREHDIDVYDGKIKKGEFYRKFENTWSPDIVYVSTFGQKLNSKIFGYPRYGSFNLHPCYDDGWPSYKGGNPFSEILADGKRCCVISLHQVNEEFDEGELVCLSEKIPIPPGCNVLDLHKITSFTAGRLVGEHFCRDILQMNAK